MSDLIYRSGVKAGLVAFKAVKSIVRPADNTAYTIGDLINATGATGLIEVDFGIEMKSHVIDINFAAIISSNGTVATKLDAGLYFFNNVTVKGAANVVQKDDNAPFIPTFAETIAKKEGPIETLSGMGQIGTTNYTVYAGEKTLTIKLDDNGKTFIAAVANNAYVPELSEKLTFIIKGFDMG